MPTPANPTALAQQARRSYAERLLAGMPAVVQAIDQGAKMLAAAVAEPAVALKRRELLPILQRAFPIWQDGMMTLLKAALATGTVVQTRLGELPKLYRPTSALTWNGTPFQGVDGLVSLVENMPPTKHDIQSFDCHPIPGPLFSLWNQKTTS
jgi:hypothetical protein